jgi:S-adenosylmethionine decarboxylase
MNTTKSAVTAIKARATAKAAPEELFGTHLTLDGYGADPVVLSDMDQIFAALHDLPEILGMHKLTTPYVVRAYSNDKRDAGGYSGFVMIAESHISIHTFPGRSFVSIDVYTCQGDLDVKTATSYFQKIFGVRTWEQHVIKRGRQYGKQ